MKMTPSNLVVGILLIFAAIVFVVVLLPYFTYVDKGSEIYRERSTAEADGRKLYMANGCVYCHSQSIRSIDWDLGAERIAQAGDYVSDRPILLGSARTGPDLSQEGGEHPDDWHVAHFTNPRYTRPSSIMPPFAYLGQDRISALTIYVQSLGLKNADRRMERQRSWKEKSIKAYEAGIEENVKWLHSHVPEGWRTISNPYPTTDAGLARGHVIYQNNCLGCHGPNGDGMGPDSPIFTLPPSTSPFSKAEGRWIRRGAFTS